MPFCILDEIDSALDEANSNLLGQYLKKFSDDTQFVIVTHKNLQWSSVMSYME